MKTKLIIIALFFNSICNAQIESIQLPKSKNFEIKYSNNYVTPLLKVYVDKQNNVYLKDSLININDLGNRIFLFKKSLRLENIANLKVLLYADKKTNYITVDRVKSEISSAKIPHVFYRTNNIDDITSGLGLKNQGSLNYIKKPLRKAQKTDEVVIIDFPGIREHPIKILKNKLYDKNFNYVKFKLKELKYINIELLNGKKLKIGDKKVRLSDTEKIYDLIKNLDFYFITVKSNLNYNEYFKNISTLIKMYRNKKVDIPFIEISGELQRLLKSKEKDLLKTNH